MRGAEKNAGKSGEFQKLNSIVFEGKKVYYDNFRCKIKERCIQKFIKNNTSEYLFDLYIWRSKKSAAKQDQMVIF